MAKYRRTMHANEHRNLLNVFQDDIDTAGGIFTPATRRRLLGVRGEHNQEGKPDTPDFWQNVRDYTKAALRDLELLANVAESKQLEEIFATRENFRDWDAQSRTYKRPDPLAYLSMLLRHENPEEWRTNLGLAMVALGFKWRASYTVKLQNPLIKRAFDDAQAAAELLAGRPPAASRKGPKKGKIENVQK